MADLTPEGVMLREKTIELVRTEPEGVPLESALVVVAGGTGVGSMKGGREIGALADALNGVLGSTHPSVDEGWTELETMIGQNGKMANPDFYMDVGLSGELQHMLVITDAKVIVAINNDRNPRYLNRLIMVTWTIVRNLF